MIEEEEEAAHLLRKKLYFLGQDEAARAVQPGEIPLWPGREFPERILRHADRILVMSATLPPPQVWAYLHNVGMSDIMYLNAPDTWPNNSPLVIWPVVSLNHQSPPEDLDTLALSIQQILTDHSDQKGIIHAHSYSLLHEMYERIDDERIVWGFERKAAILRFMRSPAPAVLFAAAVHEGFDLPYELGFQIIPKVPFPSLGDVRVKRRAKEYRAWYAMETINAIAQTWGRVVRAPDDAGVTYLLDAEALRMIREWPDMWPPWIKRQTSVWPVG